jgi:hypothetical protein
MKIYIAFLLLFLALGIASAQTDISGVLTGDTTLTLAYSPWVVTGDLTVPSGDTLTIQPGVTVKFASGTTLNIEGAMIANGQSSATPITFTSNSGSPAPGDWVGIALYNTANVGTIINYCMVLYAGGGTNEASIYYKTGAPVISITHTTVSYSAVHGVNLRASSPAIMDSKFSNNGGFGIYSDLITNSVIESCLVVNNTGGGIRIPINSAPVVQYCTIDTNGTGIFVDNGATPTIAYNNIRRNSIGIEWTNVGVAQPVITRDTIKNNTQAGFINLSTSSTVNALRNYWGAESGPYNAASNPTGTGNSVSNYVNYSPWATLVPPPTPITISSNITTNTVWTPGVYLLTTGINIYSGATLTIRPGTIVKFASGAGLYVNGGCGIVANGNSDSLIVFTSSKDDGYGGNSTGDTTAHVPAPGNWDCVYLTNALSTSSFTNCVFKWGGYYGRGDLYMDTQAPTALDHLYITNSSNQGIQMNGLNPMITNSIISGNGNYGIYAYGNARLSMVHCTVNSNGNTGIDVDGGGSEATIVRLDSSTVSFNGGNGAYSWYSVGAQAFTHSRFEQNHGVGLWSFKVDTVTANISNDTLLNNGSDGLGTSKAFIANNQFQGNRFPIALIGDVNSHYSGNTFTGNQYNNVLALRVDRGPESFWDTLTGIVPAGFSAKTYYFVENVGPGVNGGNTFVIDSGVTMKFAYQIYLNVNGTLVASGTQAHPIVFTSYRDSTYGGFTNGTDHNLPSPGDWGDVEIEIQSGAGNSVINNCVFKYGGYYSVGNLHIQYNGTLANPVTNVLSRKSSNYGIRVDDAIATFNLVKADSNGSAGIYLTNQGSNVIVENGTFQDNNAAGLYAEYNNVFSNVSNCVIQRNNGDGIHVVWGEVAQVFNGNTIASNAGSGIWVNSSVAPGSLQFIGNNIENNGWTGVWSTAGRFIDNTINANTFAIGEFGQMGNIYVDNSNVDGNIITNNTWNNTIALAGSNYAPLSDTMKNVFPQAITSHTYTVVEDIQVSASTTLVIQPGVIVKFSEYNGYHQFNVYGTIISQGTAASPIYFTSWRDNTLGGKTSAITDTNTMAYPGDWYFVAFRNGSGSSVAQHCVYKYGGRDNNQTVYFEQNLGSLIFSDNEIRKSYAGGIVVYNTALVIDSTTIDSCNGNGIYLQGNVGNVVNVLYCNIWYNGGEGLWAYNTSNFSVVSHCNVSHNGGDGIYVMNNSVPLSVQGNTVNWNAGDGIYLVAVNDAVDTLINCSGNDVRNNGVIGLTTSRALVEDDSVTGNRYGFGVTGEISLTGKSTENGNVYINDYSGGNKYEGILMTEGTVYGVLGASWPPGYTTKVIAVRGNLTVPSGTTISIVQGTILKFPVEWGNGTFDVQGTLKSEGTASQKIVFTSWHDDTYGGDSNADSNATVPGSGDWDRVYLDGTGADSSVILNTIIRYGGVTGNGGLEVYNNNAPIDSSYISFARYYGVYFNNAPSTMMACDIHDNPQDGILVQGTATPVIEYCNIYNNGRFGLNNNTSSTTNAQSNYWGAQSGPLVNQGSPQNLSGTGNQIYLNPGEVTYDPFFTTRSGILLGDVSGNGTITAYDASLVLQDLVGNITLTTPQLLAGEVTGDASVSALDASYILQFVVGLITGFPGSGKLNAAIASSAFDVRIEPGSAANQYVAILRAKDPTNVLANEIHFAYDSTVVTPVGVQLTDLSHGMTMAYGFHKGEARIALAGTKPLDHAGGDVVKLVFTMKTSTGPSATNPLKVAKFVANNIDLTSQITITNNTALVPHTYALQQNYPNPFNPTTQIEYQLPVAGSVKLTIYNTRGQEVRALVNDNQSAGYYNVTWDSKNNNGETVASGVYYYRIEAVGAQHQLFTLVKKMLLLK